MDTCYRCSALIEAFLTSAAEGDWDKCKTLQGEIVQLEREADDVKRDIRYHLPQGVFLPVPRPDLLDLLTRQDRIANKAKDIAGMVLGRRLRFPAEMVDAVHEFTQACVAACSRAHAIVRELDDLLDTGFGGREMQRVHAMIRELDREERACDEQEVVLRATLFELESGLGPVDVMFMYRIIERVGDLANIAQRVGHRIDLLLAK